MTQSKREIGRINSVWKLESIRVLRIHALLRLGDEFDGLGKAELSLAELFANSLFRLVDDDWGNGLDGNVRVAGFDSRRDGR